MSANAIQLKGGFRLEEAAASGQVSPGMLLRVTSAGAFAYHATEGGYAERLVAVEDALQGKTVDDAYATTELVSAHLVDPGAEVQMLIAAGEDISIGDKLISAGDGTLIESTSKASSTTIYQVIAIAVEACDLTDSDAENTLAAVRML